MSKNQGPATSAGPCTILLGVTGGIAAYKAPILARLLIKDGHDVRVIPTDSALEMVGAPTFAALTGHAVATSVFDDPEGVDHVRLGAEADLLIIAPATANTMAKLAAGIADNLLTATALVATCPVLVAPAMHTQMWNHPATRDNVETLRARGITVLEPASGRLTGADSGVGRLPEPEDIHRAALKVLDGPRPTNSEESAKDGLAGRRFLVSAGGTREPIDPVRYLGNRSSGRQGIEIARAAARLGAEVTLVACNVSEHLLPTEPGIEILTAQTALDLREIMVSRAPEADCVVQAAAVADYRPAEAASTKHKRSEGKLKLDLVENPDILAELAAMGLRGLVVGFAAETGGEKDVLTLGMEKARRKGADLLAINEVGEDRGFGDVDNEVVIVRADGSVVSRAAGPKSRIAEALLTAITLELDGLE
ncbi:MAG: bifunctional phosphopantothenoylcysteine decarboxylase/phosphopantothenate--cysteine ligase CoaBC [Flaviflexus sp.]|nr:bifunctional phosphopantothenoylcysteine decarboxylase/phosphopantothenate--cysteine ligase CoaBC [Flaviflexus sp.]